MWTVNLLKKGVVVRILISLLVLLALTERPARGVLISTGPFSGDMFEGFEGLSNSTNLSVFGGAANLTSTWGLTPTGWTFHSRIVPFEGSLLYGSSAGPATLTFNDPIAKFGGYFGTNSVDASTDAPDATANIFDFNDTLLSSETISLGLGATWTWNGWESDNGNEIKRIEIVGPTFGGAYVQIDSLQATSIPDPSMFVLFGLCTGGVVLRRLVHFARARQA